MRTQIPATISFRQAVKRVRETCVGAYDHQAMPFEKLVEELQPVRDLSRNPIFQIVFSLQTAGGGVRSMGGKGAAAGEVTARFDLTLNLTETNDGLDGILQDDGERRGHQRGPSAGALVRRSTCSSGVRSIATG